MSVDDFRTEQFNQSDILGMKKDVLKGTNAAGGICQELCWKWLKRLSTKASIYNSPEKRMGALWKESTVDKAISRHNAATFMTVPQQFYGVTKGAYSSKFLYDKEMVSRFLREGGGLVIAVTCPKYNNEKHAIAFFIPKGSFTSKVLFFDPNEGEYEMSQSRFYWFLPEFIKVHYGAVLADIKETVIWNGRVG